MKSNIKIGTENAALASGTPSTSRVAERYEKGADTCGSIAPTTRFSLSIFLLAFIYIGLPYVAHASATFASPDNTGLVGYWSLDASTINWATGVVRDLSGKGNNGHVVNMSTTTSPATTTGIFQAKSS